MITPGELLPQLSALADQDEALAQLRGYWLQSDDREGFAALARGALAFPRPHPMVPLVLRLAEVAPDLDVEVELRALWSGWSQLDLRTRQALAAAVARRVNRSVGSLGVRRLDCLVGLRDLAAGIGNALRSRSPPLTAPSWARAGAHGRVPLGLWAAW